MGKYNYKSSVGVSQLVAHSYYYYQYIITSTTINSTKVLWYWTKQYTLALDNLYLSFIISTNPEMILLGLDLILTKSWSHVG